jgi:ABC-type antimicrobial peptide transport system permease subunit
VSAISADDTGRAQSEIASLLRDRHHLRPADDDDFNIRNLTEMANAQQQGTQTLTALLAAIAIVSLVVGGIGIMNIMLVSVTERTRGIGVRTAAGARPWHVLPQFLAEAVTLSMIGGLMGVVLGSVIARVVATRLGWAYSPRLDMIFLMNKEGPRLVGPKHPVPHRYEAEGGATGALAGAIVGASAGPAGAIAGALIGGAAGAFAGTMMSQESSAMEQRTRELDAG